MKKVLLALSALLCLAGCASPISVRQLSLTSAYQDRNQSSLTGGRLSNLTRTVLQRENLLPLWQDHPARALLALQERTRKHFYTNTLDDQLFALAELNYIQGRRHRDRAAFLAAALYAYAYINPTGTADERPSPYDTHLRQACDLYMFGLTEALGTPVNAVSQQWHLSSGQVAISVDPAQLHWHGHEVTDIRPVARLAVRGFENIYRQPGLGEPVGALPRLTTQENQSFQIANSLRVPMNLMLIMSSPRQQILSDHVSARLQLTPINENIAGQQAPLQFDQTTTLAESLNDAMDWSVEYRGFLDGRLFNQGDRPQLLTIEPHQYGHRPVVLVHGTASSAARWANMVNDLMEDSVIRNHYEFWFFSYATGNPIPYSALQLRQALEKAVAQLGGAKTDPALGKITLIGHSQGGLLAKMLVVNTGDRLWNGMISVPLSRLKLRPADETLLRDALFPTPLPEARSVVFISTPQHGSYIAGLSVAQLVGRLVTFPVSVQEVIRSVFASSPEIRKLNMRPWRVGSVYGMSPHSSFIRSLAAIPVAPGIEGHSIIPVLGDGPLATADDGVVMYESAHVPDVQSELVVRHSGHSTQSNPVTTAEVRRILIRQLEQDGTVPPETDQGGQGTVTSLGGTYTLLRQDQHL
ncbi:lipase family alpha/beta hydrolase [Gluconobacter sp.]|uniref:lipase family alpha/beta hydrolase n=1 Tax=Gluconobacter sp. TaxID=1876758 RepID=UPI0039E86FDA